MVTAAVQKLRQRTCPFANLPERGAGPYLLNQKRMQKCVWVRPHMQAEIEFVNWTADAHLRHPAVRRLLSQRKAHRIEK